MDALKTFVAAEVGVFAGGLAVLVAYRLLTADINIEGLLNDKSPGLRRRGRHAQGDFSPARLQMLLASLTGISVWALGFANSGGQIPDVPPDLLLLLGGSHALYLTSKSTARLHLTGEQN